MYKELTPNEKLKIIETTINSNGLSSILDLLSEEYDLKLEPKDNNITEEKEKIEEVVEEKISTPENTTNEASIYASEYRDVALSEIRKNVVLGETPKEEIEEIDPFDKEKPHTLVKTPSSPNPYGNSRVVTPGNN